MRIVIISLHYGEEGSGGARRAYLWAKGLRKAGHHVHVVSPYVSDQHPHDILVPHPNRGSEMYNPPKDQPGVYERLVKSHLRNWLLWPDPEIRWHRQVVNLVEKRINEADWLITTSPPESSHAIGGILAKKLNTQWCAELRDSWIEDSHRTHIKGPRAAIERHFAKRWLRSANAITSVNEQITAEGSVLAPRAVISTIGHFSEPFTGLPAKLDETAFNLVHAGGFKRSDRRRSLSQLLLHLEPIFSQRPNLHLHLCGPLTYEETQLLKTTKQQVTYHGWISLSESRALQAAADGVLLYTPFENTRALPGKYAEYCNLRKPIFFLGSERVKAMAHRRDEFYSLEDLADFPKNKLMPAEKDATVESATEKLLTLFKRAST